VLGSLNQNCLKGIIVSKNNGKIDDRMEADGLKLVELLQKVHYETGVVKTF